MLKGWKTVSGIWQLCVKASAQQPAHSPAAVKAQGTTTRKKKTSNDAGRQIYIKTNKQEKI